LETVADKIIQELKDLNEKPSAEGGIADVLPLTAVYFGDPGLIPASLYPAVTVEPASDDSEGETTGYDKRDLRLNLSIHIDARQYFDANADEAIGDRMLVQVTSLVLANFRRRSKRTLDGTVTNITVGPTQYRTQQRGNVISKSSRTTLIVRKNYARTLD